MFLLAADSLSLVLEFMLVLKMHLHLLTTLDMTLKFLMVEITVLDTGVDRGTYPSPRVVSLGVKLKF